MLSAGLNYYKKLDAMSVRNNKERVAVQPVNGSTFTSNTGKIRVVIPCNQPGKYADLKNFYMIASIKNNDATAAVNLQGSVGAMGLIKKIRFATDSETVFSELDNQNVLMGMKIDESVEKDWLGNNTKSFGTGLTAIAGAAIGIGATITLGIPLMASGLASTPYFPLGGRENLVLEFFLENAKTACIGDAGLAETEIEISNVVCYYDVYKLDSTENDKLLEQFSNVLRIQNTDFAHTSDLIPLAATSRVINLGFAFERVKKMYVCLRTDDFITNATKTSLQARNKAKISKITVLHNGSIVGSRAVNVSSSTSENAEAFLELMKCNGGIWNLHTTHLDSLFDVDEGAANTENSSGKYYFVACFENGFENSESISGLDIRQGSFQVQIDKAASDADQRVDIFVEYHSEYALDMNDSGGIWSVKK
jgi:hypothetical protein